MDQSTKWTTLLLGEAIHAAGGVGAPSAPLAPAAQLRQRRAGPGVGRCKVGTARLTHELERRLVSKKIKTCDEIS